MCINAFRGPCFNHTDAIMLAELHLPMTTATTAPVGPCRLDPACMLATHVFLTLRPWWRRLQIIRSSPRTRRHGVHGDRTWCPPPQRRMQSSRMRLPRRPVAVPVADHPVASATVAVPVADHPDVASAPAATPVADHPEVVSEEAPAADDVVMTSAPTADAEVIPSSPTADDEMIPSSPTAEAEAGSVAEPQVEPAAPPVRMWMDLQTIVREIEEEMRLEQASTVQLHVQLFSKVCDQFLLSATTVMYTANTFSFGLWLFRLEGTLGPALGRLCISNSCCCWGKVELRVGRHY
jgi:hypothetical protein